mmetsp:Transcript_23677/g.51037  ORF Transcript_23677/g.51037 Transcript_23677/m.51037 type:complete len:239 (-) Transcript_23677:184-900(-)
MDRTNLPQVGGSGTSHSASSSAYVRYPRASNETTVPAGEDIAVLRDVEDGVLADTDGAPAVTDVEELTPNSTNGPFAMTKASGRLMDWVVTSLEHQIRTNIPRERRGVQLPDYDDVLYSEYCPLKSEQLRDRSSRVCDEVWSSWVREFNFPTKSGLHGTESNTVSQEGCSARPVKGLEGMGDHSEHEIRLAHPQDEEDEDDRLNAAHRIVWAAVKLVTALVTCPRMHCVRNTTTECTT